MTPSDRFPVPVTLAVKSNFSARTYLAVL